MLRSYSFGLYNGCSEIPNEVLGLFTCLVEDSRRTSEFASEIVVAGMNGRIDCTKDFNMAAYEARIRHNQTLSMAKRAKNEVALEFDSEREEPVNTNRVVLADYAAAHVSSVMQLKDAYEEILDENELSFAVETIKQLQDVMLIDEEVDLIASIRQALKFMPDAMSEVRRICSTYSIVAEQIKTILGSGKSFEELFPAVL